MLAISLSIALFAFWVLVGSAALALLNRQGYPIRNLLLAPTVGVAVTLLPVFWLNRLGLPVRQFGLGLGIFLLLASLGLLYQLRPKLPWREYLPFLLIFLLSFVLAGRPMFEFGFAWLSYANADMANYSLAAHHFLDHGFFAVPDIEKMINGYDYGLQLWFLYLGYGIRVGSELLLAWVISCVGLNAHEVFMPLIFAYHLILISVTTALVFQNQTFKFPALITCLLLTFSANNTLGTLYQLIAQVNGLSLLISCLVILSQSQESQSWKDTLKTSTLGAIQVAALLVTYPEVLSFLVASLILYILIIWIGSRSFPNSIVIKALIVLIGCLVLINSYIQAIFKFMLHQSSIGLSNEGSLVTFNYYFLPSGLSDFWGISTIGLRLPEPLLSISIFLGAILLVTAVLVTLFELRLKQLTAVVTSVMLGVGIILFVRRADFGLFKLVLFIQPFILATVAIAFSHVFRSQRLQVMAAIFLCALSSVGQFMYVQQSRALSPGGLASIANISRSEINREFNELVKATPPDKTLILDTSSLPLAKFQTLYTKNRRAVFLGKDFFDFSAYHLDYDNAIGSSGQKFRDFTIAETSRTLRFAPLKKFETSFLATSFNLLDEDDPDAKNSFVAIDLLDSDAANDKVLIATTGIESIFNRSRNQAIGSSNFLLKPWGQVRNWLVFVDSQKGNHYYGGRVGTAAFYQLENDWFYPGKDFSALGRHCLIRVIHPSAGARLVINLTASLKGDGKNLLPEADVIGAKRQPFPILGRGSARVFSPPLEPQIINGQPYLAVDMNASGDRLTGQQGLLTSLYGNDIPVDSRQVVAFGRDISLISAEDYASLQTPSQLSQFPSDLANPNVEYSGFYEDGWLSEAAYVYLNQAQGANQLLVQGTIPPPTSPDFKNEFSLMLDGQTIAKQILQPGDFAVQVPVPPGQGRKRLEFRFANLQPLLPPDNRPAAMRIKFLGFVAAQNQPLPSRLSRFPEDLSSPDFERSGIFEDGWMTASPQVALLQPNPEAQLVLRGNIPTLGDPNFTTELALKADGVEILNKVVKPGDFEIKTPLPRGSGVRRIELRFSKARPLPSPDGRIAGAYLKFIGFEE